MYLECENLSAALIAVCQQLLEHGKPTVRRGFNCTEFPGAVMVCITNPTDRYVRVPERKWNKTLGWIESLWLARGDNSLAMPSAYVKNLLNFSDDGDYMRAGYGPRLRRYGDNEAAMTTGQGMLLRQYCNGVKKNGLGQLKAPSKYQNATDQLRFVIEKFKEDIDTREAVISIADPVSDDFNGIAGKDASPLIKTKDTPCTRSIHFMIVDGKMNCYVDMRSNDVIWGFSAVNIFNFTLMQEYVAAIVGVPVGKYYHKADNLHAYEDFLPMVQEIAKHYQDYFSSGIEYRYEPTYHSLEEFDTLIKGLSEFEEAVRSNFLDKNKASQYIKKQKDPLFQDWARVIYCYWFKEVVEFNNPLLNELFTHL